MEKGKKANINCGSVTGNEFLHKNAKNRYLFLCSQCLMLQIVTAEIICECATQSKSFVIDFRLFKLSAIPLVATKPKYSLFLEASINVELLLKNKLTLLTDTGWNSDRLIWSRTSPQLTTRHSTACAGQGHRDNLAALTCSSPVSLQAGFVQPLVLLGNIFPAVCPGSDPRPPPQLAPHCGPVEPSRGRSYSSPARLLQNSLNQESVLAGLFSVFLLVVFQLMHTI